MKKYIMPAILCAFTAQALIGCGSGGGGSNGSAPPAATNAITKVSLFGNMSTNSIIATVQTSMTVPNGVMVNYSSPPGFTTGTFPLRSGVVVPSGPVQVSRGDISGSFDTVSRKLTISLVNSGSLNLSSSSTGNGAEIATVNLPLASPGVTPALPTEDSSVLVGQKRSGPTVDYLTGFKTIFSTTYQ